MELTEQQRLARREAQARYRLRHPERVLAAKLKHKFLHPTAQQEAKRKYRQTEHGRTVNTAYMKRWRERNPDRARALSRQDRLRRTEAIDAYIRRWKQANPERVRVYRSTSKARRRIKTTAELSHDLIARLLLLQKTRCAICHRKLTTYHLDHIYPLHLGGPHQDTNIQLLCPPCNIAKSFKDPIVFMQEQGKLL